MQGAHSDAEPARDRYIRAAYAALKKDPRDLGWVRRRLDKLSEG